MKKALVYIKPIDGRIAGQVSMTMEAGEMDKWSHHHVSNGFAVKVEIPAALEALPENQLEGVLVLAQVERWTKGTETVEIEPTDLTGWTYYPAIQEHYEIRKGTGYKQYDKDKRISEAYNLMQKLVLDEMKVVYNTTNPESATASYLTWMSMKNTPASFSTAGLLAKHSIGTITVGDALNTDALVLEYASGMIELSENYAVFREQKIQEFVATKTAIQAE